MPKIIAYSPGKCILTGEHSVVYGYPAVSMALDKGVTVEIIEGENQDENIQKITDIFYRNFKIVPTQQQLGFKVSSDIPFGSGLGASAALAHAIYQALAKKFSIKMTNEQFFDLIQASEKEFHGNPSGIDAATVVHGGMISFQKKETGYQFEKLDFPISLMPNFELIQSGRPAESTKEMVDFVRSNYEKSSEYKKLIEDIGDVSTKFIDQLKNNIFDLNLVTANQRLLEKIGVVSEATQKLIREIEINGGVAKITGAGGIKQGSGMIIKLWQK